MKVLIAFFAVLAVAKGFFGLFEKKQAAVRGRFDISPLGHGSSSFYSIPVTREDAEKDGWTVEEGPDNPNYNGLTLYCYVNKIVCVLIDSNGMFGGMQVALPVKDFNNCEMFDDPEIMRSRGYNEWNSTVDGTVQQFNAIAFFTNDPATIGTSAENSIEDTNGGNPLLKNGGIWVQGPGGLMKIPSTQTEIEAEGVFTKQAFIPAMGRHYYYKMTETLECTSDNLFPWFPLTYDGEIVALGLLNFGTYSRPGKSSRLWFEQPGKSDVKLIVPRGPECMYDLVDKCGLATMHIYFRDDPYSSIINIFKA